MLLALTLVVSAMDDVDLTPARQRALLWLRPGEWRMGLPVGDMPYLGWAVGTGLCLRESRINTVGDRSSIWFRLTPEGERARAMVVARVTNDGDLNPLLRGAIDDALLFAHQSGARQVVGLREGGNGAEVVFLPLGQQRQGFTPAWLVTPKGEVLPCKPERAS